ncbi:MAG: endonuclease V [Sedimentisphaerales bacterium]|nr:endonuclease V [Sedimentisphaerales bacterium]
MTPAQAIQLQKELALSVRLIPLGRLPQTIAAIDCAFSRDKKRIAAIAVQVCLPELKIIQTSEAVLDVTFPYVPGLLSFREAPVCIEAMRMIRGIPDVVLIDGQGIAHPRRFGLASHIGVWLDCPTIGCAKSRLIGQFERIPVKKGKYELLKDKNDIIGSVLCTRNQVKPLFISPGHKITLDQSIKIVLSCCTRYRLPDPARLAHQLVTQLREKL